MLVRKRGYPTQWYRYVNKWYLRKSVDRLGNKVEYSYHSDSRNTNCGHWYYETIRPASIQWGGNEQSGLGHKFRVNFGYEGRGDYHIWLPTQSQHGGSCQPAMRSRFRLKTVRVEVHSAGAWRPLREY